MTVEELTRGATLQQCGPQRGAAPSTIEECAAWIGDLALHQGLVGPAAIVGLAPPYYPRADWNGGDHLKHKIQAVAAAEAMGVSLRSHFPGISDMSFLNPVADGSHATVRANCPARTSPVASEAAAAGFPAVNIGPWGRDYHQRLERMHARYCFEQLPELLWNVVKLALTRP